MAGGLLFQCFAFGQAVRIIVQQEHRKILRLNLFPAVVINNAMGIAVGIVYRPFGEMADIPLIMAQDFTNGLGVAVLGGDNGFIGNSSVMLHTAIPPKSHAGRTGPFCGGC